jgi:hypothetical protein
MALRRAGADDDAFVKVLCSCRSNLSKGRAQLLIAKATTEPMLCRRLCDQVRSFVAEDHTITTHAKSRLANETIALVAFPDPDSWLEDRYCIYKRLGDGLSEESPTATELTSKMNTELCLALVAREDGFEEANSTNVFEEGDSVLAIVQSTRKDYFLKKLSESYDCAAPVIRQSNLPPEFLLIFCGELPNSQFFDPLRRKTRLHSASGLELAGGLLADARSQIYLAGYPPSSLKYSGTVLVPKTEIVVNGRKKQLGQFFQSLSALRQLTACVIEFKSEKLEFKISALGGREKSKFRFGFPLFEQELGPTAVALNTHQPSLRGAAFTEEVAYRDNTSLVSLTGIDLIMLVDKGKRVTVAEPVLEALLDCIRVSSEYRSLADIAMLQISENKSVPVKAMQSSAMRALIEAHE